MLRRKPATCVPPDGIDVIDVAEDMFLVTGVVDHGHFHGHIGAFIVPIAVHHFRDQREAVGVLSIISTNSVIPPSL